MATGRQFRVQRWLVLSARQFYRLLVAERAAEVTRCVHLRTGWRVLTNIARHPASPLFFRIEWLQSRSLIERISSLPLPQAPTFWNDPSSAPLRQTLQEWDNSNRDSYPFVWWNIAQLKLVLPYLKPVLRTLVDGAFVEADQTTCVVHFRTGDFFSEQRRGWNKRQLHLSIAALIAAAKTLPQLPRRFEVLGGGRITIATSPPPTAAPARCGSSRMACGARCPSAEVALVGGSADDDFLRAASAPMLLIGCDGMELVTGSSFAVYAAAASNGHVRSPACFLRFGACMKANNVDTPPLAPNWLGYPHPNCKECREEMKTDPTQWAVIQAALDEMGEARVADSGVSKWLAEEEEEEGRRMRRRRSLHVLPLLSVIDLHSFTQ